MPQVIEIARFRVDPARERDFLARRNEAIEAISEAFPGLIRVQLGHIQNDLWVDVALWESLEDAKRAAAGCMAVPAFKQWCSYITEELGVEHAVVEEPADV